MKVIYEALMFSPFSHVQVILQKYSTIEQQKIFSLFPGMMRQSSGKRFLFRINKKKSGKVSGTAN